MYPTPLFLLPKPNNPEPPAESNGREVEWIKVSSRSSTSVFGVWNGVCLAGGVGVTERERVAGGVSEVGATAALESEMAGGMDMGDGGISFPAGGFGGEGGRDSGDGIAGWYGGWGVESSNTGEMDGGLSSLLSSSVSFSSSSELSSTAASSAAPGEGTGLYSLVKGRKAARRAFQNWKMMRKKTRRRKARDASPGLDRLDLSVEETEGRRDGGREGFLRDIAGPRREEAGERMFGLTSAGDE